MAHALARLGKWLADRPTETRREMARDAVQEALARSLARQGSFDPTAGSSPRGWLHGFLNNVLSEFCQKLRKQPFQPPLDSEKWEILTGQIVASDPGSSLSELLDLLAANDRELVVLHHLDGLSHQEIGMRLGISAGSARTRLCRAMAKLAAIADHDKEGDR